MFKPSKFAFETMKSLEAEYRIRHSASTFKLKDDKGVLDAAVDSNKIYCEIQDRATGVWYCEATGESESEALDNALRKALVTPKPMTAAQKNAVDPAVLSEKEALIAEQRAQIAALQAKLNSKGGRKTVVPEPTEQTVES